MVVIALFIVGCATGRVSENGIYRPSLSTYPRPYLKSFPLDKISEAELIEYVGMPDKTYSSGSAKYFTIDIGSKNSNGKIEYTYIISSGVVHNVTYVNAGNFFGVTQNESARLLQIK